MFTILYLELALPLTRSDTHEAHYILLSVTRTYDLANCSIKHSNESDP